MRNLGTPARTKLVTVSGTVALDTVETPAGSSDRQVGGAAVYSAAAARLLADVVLVGVAGDDFPIEQVAFREGNVDLSGLRRSSGQTMTWHAQYAADLSDRTTVSSDPGVAATVDPVVPAAAQRGSVLFLGSQNPRIQADVLDQVRSPTLVGLDTMTHWIQDAFSAVEALVRRCDVLFVNEMEAIALGRAEDASSAANHLRALGPTWVIVKRGRRGAVAYGHDTVLEVEAPNVRATVDPTGAGDAFAGGFLASVAGDETLDPRAVGEALRVGAASGSIAVEGFGISCLAGVTPSDLMGRAEALGVKRRGS